jgi:thiol:disulfide interchange protein
MPPQPQGSSRSTRSVPWVLIGAAGALLIARIAFGIYRAAHPVPLGGLVHWTSPSDAAAAGADGDDGRPVLYDFSATWCEPCQQMERQVFADPEAAAFINATYRPVRVGDEDASAAADGLRAQNRVTGLPTLVVQRRGGARSHLEGYAGKRRTLAFLAGAAQEHAEPPPQ